MNAALIYRIESGKINAWSTVNIPFAKQLTAEEVKALTTDKQKIDTTIQIQNGYVNVINNRDFSPDHINAYEILEKWSFRPADGETEVTIKGIAPICDIYGTGQSNRNTIISRKTLFWVDYNDILPIIRKEVPYYPTNNFTVQIWNQFFTADTKPILEN